ncbi:hypothetical protein [Glaciibacter psychrotolerans]|uniref:Uncharacterized protein n=1 Tax=Glaciibacter psychrotolerans TaxID=670054 RepID=A0A7Z0EHD3_9MICO|nr:hypothetical protein [Leifsonia psychrotolerans]NYJ21701.1 hypothetical protein [Leifsonia psychrotolerans]
MNRQWISVAVVWLLGALCALVVGLLSSPGNYLAWIGLSLAGCTIATLCIQLATGQKKGYVSRVTASIVGATLVLAAATGVFALMGLS